MTKERTYHRLFGRLAVLSTLLFLVRGKQILEDDNIAVPQEQFAQFFLPAPSSGGFPTSERQRQQSFLPNQDIADNFIGNLLPLEPRQAMPSISSLDVACHDGYMDVQLTFDRPFGGVIYSKGYYESSQCQYIVPGSSQNQYTFQLRADSCGTQYIESPGQKGYLENVIIIQNEPGIQEIWDTARGIRCVYDGAATSRSRKTVSAALNVAMLDQQVVTFASKSDTDASASMDIQIGRGPFAPSASGLVKIGELMTMVVKVDGPSGVDVLVRQCVAHDGTPDNTIGLTDEDGCVLKKKILGSWQKDRSSSSQDAPMMAFAHFQAFKFPDKMDVFIECEVDLCNGGCSVCAEDGPGFTGRKRRSVPQESLKKEPSDFASAVDKAEEEFDRSILQRNANSIPESSNKTTNSGLRLAKRLRVLSPDDISLHGDKLSPFTLVTKTSSGRDAEDVCITLTSLISAVVAMLLLVILASIMTAVICIRVRTIPSTSSSFPPESSFHAFSTVSGKTA